LLDLGERLVVGRRRPIGDRAQGLEVGGRIDDTCHREDAH
jgi:hypothetical protein